MAALWLTTATPGRRGAAPRQSGVPAAAVQSRLPSSHREEPWPEALPSTAV